jgi:hypothetical protein
MKPPYYTMQQLIAMMDEPNRSVCQRIMDDNVELFSSAPGSTHNHQTWEGGYWDHVVEVMNLWVLLYQTFEATGRLDQLIAEEKFTLADGLPVLFLHDIEKPWRCLIIDGHPMWGEDGQLEIDPALASKAERKAFAAAKLQEYGIELSPQQQNALKYVEGIRDEDYTPGSRLMLPLAALCHMCDMLSARAFYDAPLAAMDAWAGDTGREH